MVNLLANAQTASPPDQPVEVSAEIAADQVSLIIADSGPGVPAELRDRIFEPFQRLHDRSTTGLGLGLAIARASWKRWADRSGPPTLLVVASP